LKFITKIEDFSIFETIYPLYLKANIGRDAPDIILSKKPSSQIKGKSKQKSAENEDLESEYSSNKSRSKIPKFKNYNLKEDDKQICSFIFKADKTDSLRFINQTRNYEQNQKYNRLGYAFQSKHLYHIRSKHLIWSVYYCPYNMVISYNLYEMDHICSI